MELVHELLENEEAKKNCMAMELFFKRSGRSFKCVYEHMWTQYDTKRSMCYWNGINEIYLHKYTLIKMEYDDPYLDDAIESFFNGNMETQMSIIQLLSKYPDLCNIFNGVIGNLTRDNGYALLALFQSTISNKIHK